MTFRHEPHHLTVRLIDFVFLPYFTHIYPIHSNLPYFTNPIYTWVEFPIEHDWGI